MKVRLLLVMLLICGSLYSSAQNEVTKLKQMINAEKRSVQQLSTKRDNLITSYQIVAKDYITTNAKKDSLSQKPNSPAYKNAVKKAEKLLKERTELLASIKQVKAEIDSINLVLATHESQLQELQSQKAEAPKEKKSVNGNVTKQDKEKTERRKDKKEKVVANEIPVKKDKKENTTSITHEEDATIEEVTEHVAEEPSNKGNSNKEISKKNSNDNDSSSDSFFSKLLSKIWKFIKICLWVIGGIIAIVILKAMGGGKRTSHSTSNKSASDIYRDGQKRFIAGHESTIARLKVDLERAKAQYEKTRDRTAKKRVDQIKIQIAEEKRKIQDLKSSLRN